MSSERDTPAEAVVEFRRTLKADGLWAGMRYVNSLSPYRYSAVFQFEGALLRNVCLVDREQPETRECPDMPVSDSYCVYVREAGTEFGVEHAQMDCRVLGHPKAGRFQSYYGVPVIADDNRLTGTICHFDEAPVVLLPEISAILNDIAPSVAAILAKPRPGSDAK